MKSKRSKIVVIGLTITPVPVDEYTVIYFSPTGTGSVETGVFYNPNTSTIICYRTGTIH